MITFLSSDLMFAGHVRGAANLLGEPFSMSAKLIDPWPHATPKILVVDLGSLKTTPHDLVTIARKQFPAVRFLAFGAHVQESNLQAAQEAGIDIVVTKGQFNRDPAGLLKRLLPDAASTDE